MTIEIQHPECNSVLVGYRNPEHTPQHLQGGWAFAVVLQAIFGVAGSASAAENALIRDEPALLKPTVGTPTVKNGFHNAGTNTRREIHTKLFQIPMDLDGGGSDRSGNTPALG